MLGTCGKLSVCTVNPYHIAGWYYGPFLDVRIRFIWVGIIVLVRKESWWIKSSMNKYERWLIQFVSSVGQRRGVRGVSFVTLLFTTLQVAQWSKVSDCCTEVLHDRSIPVGHSGFFFFFVQPRDKLSIPSFLWFFHYTDNTLLTFQNIRKISNFFSFFVRLP